MRLYRVTPDPFENSRFEPKFVGQEHDGTLSRGTADQAYVVVQFKRYGGGEKRQSDFEVLMDWSDIESAIRELASVRHPRAVELTSSIKLADAAKAAGWQEPSG
jgi:hypothetical protein